MPVYKTIFFILLLSLCGHSFHAHGQQHPKASNAEWLKSYKPFRIAGNLYYVGTYDLACYLVTTPKGHILINAALENTVDQLQANVAALGFKFSDIKILLISQAHFDHVGGLAAVSKLTGATVMIDEKDAGVVADGGNSDFIDGGKGLGCLFTPVKVDRMLKDHDIIELGDTRLEMLHHPGHTKGSCSYLLDVKDEHRSYRVLIANIPYMLSQVTLPGMPTYPEVGKDFIYTYAAMKKLEFDLWVSAHSSQFDLHDKRKPGAACNPALFSDKQLFYKTIAETQQMYNERLQQKK